MPYIFESYKPEREQQFEVIGYEDDPDLVVDLDAIVYGRNTSVRLDRDEVKALHEALGFWLDRTWG